MVVSAVLAVTAIVGTAVSANQASIANKRAKNAAAANKLAMDEQTAALKAQEAEPTPGMPDEAGTRRARRRSIARQLGRGGRQSTILTGGQGAAGLGG